MTTDSISIQKQAAGVRGLEHIMAGGLPKGRTALVSRAAGSAKTVLAARFLVEGIRQSGQHGVFREFTINEKGMHIGEQYRNVAGILAGNPMQVPLKDAERLEGMFRKQAGIHLARLRYRRTHMKDNRFIRKDHPGLDLSGKSIWSEGSIPPPSAIPRSTGSSGGSCPWPTS